MWKIALLTVLLMCFAVKAQNVFDLESKKSSGHLIDTNAAIKVLAKVLEIGGIPQQQQALAILRQRQGHAADELIVKWLDQLNATNVPKEIRFDLIEAAKLHNAPAIKKRLKHYNDSQSDQDEFKGWRDTLYGGDAAAGQKVFNELPEVACAGCHRIDGKGGDVGPDLTGIIQRHDREYILESILYPSKQIAPGFASVMVRTKEGQVYVGILKHETSDELTINYSDDGVYAAAKLKKSDIQSRQSAPSAMPDGFGQVLSKENIRDLIQFLADNKSANE